VSKATKRHCAGTVPWNTSINSYTVPLPFTVQSQGEG